jgi:hypothetical protein
MSPVMMWRVYWLAQKDKQRYTKYTHKTTDRVLQTSLKPGGAPEGYTVRVLGGSNKYSYCSISDLWHKKRFNFFFSLSLVKRIL